MNTEMPRRQFLGGLLAAALTLRPNRSLAGEPVARPSPRPPFPILDTHIHLYDPTRPQGVPWPSPTSAVLYQPSLPARYKPIAEPLGIVGAIEIECSSWLEDNQWVLDVADKDPFIVGTIGHLLPGTPEFRRQLDRFRANPLFRGIRVWFGRQAGREFDQPEFVADLKALADADLVLDTANPSVPLLEDVVRASDRVPHLRIVIDHLPQMVAPRSGSAADSYAALMRTLHERPNVYVKVSEVLRRVDGRIPTDLGFYRERLDEIMHVFGPDRVLFGSDWPNSDQWLPVSAGFGLVYEYFTARGREAAEKYFWRNSVACYKWRPRTAAQRAT